MPARVALLIVLLFVTACVAPSEPDAQPVATDLVEMHNNEFVPQFIEIEPGTTVTWNFDDGGRRHDVVGYEFRSPVQADGTFTHTFTEPGSYDYRCSLHRQMVGRITVIEN